MRFRLGAIALTPALVTVVLTAAPAPREVLPFIADDYPKALASARAGKRPIFLEAWAPW